MILPDIKNLSDSTQVLERLNNIDQLAITAVTGSAAWGATTLAVTQAKRYPQVRIAYFGDSITNYGMRYQAYANILSQWRLEEIARVSHSGQTSAYLLANLDDITDLDPRPDFCFVLVGANDGQGGISLASFAANVSGIAQGLIAAGIVPILATVTPLDNATYAERVASYNAWLRAYARANNIMLAEVNGALANPTNGYYASGMGVGDAVHPSSRGLKAIGQAIVDALAPIMAEPIQLVQTTEGAPNLIPNALQITDTDVDGRADGWSKQGGGALPGDVVASLEAIGNGAYWQVFTVSGSGAGTTVQRSQVTTGFAVGDTMQFAVHLDTEPAAASATPYMSLSFYTAANAFISSETIILYGPNSSSGLPIDGVIYRKFVVPPTAGRIQFVVLIGAGQGVHKFGYPTLVNLTALGIA